MIDIEAFLKKAPFQQQLINFYENALISDLNSFLDFFFCLDLKNTRATIEEKGSNACHGYAISSYYYLVKFHKNAYNQEEYINPHEWPDYMLSTILLNIATASLFICFSRSCVPQSYSKILETDDLKEEPASKFRQYEDLFALKYAVSNLFLHIDDSRSKISNECLEIIAELATQEVVAKCHRITFEMIYCNRPRDGIFIHSRFNSIARKVFEKLPNSSIISARYDQISEFSKLNLEEHRDMSHLCLELAEAYPYDTFLDKMFAYLKSSFEGLKNEYPDILPHTDPRSTRVQPLTPAMCSNTLVPDALSHSSPAKQNSAENVTNFSKRLSPSNTGPCIKKFRLSNDDSNSKQNKPQLWKGMSWIIKRSLNVYM